MRTTSVYINRVSPQKFPLHGKIKFTLKSVNPDFISTIFPVEAIFINGKAKVQLIPNMIISCKGDTYYQYEIFSAKPVPYSKEIKWDLIEKGNCIVPFKSCWLEEILIPLQQGFQPSDSNCNCENYQGATSETDGISGLVPAATSEEKDMFLKGDGTWDSPTNIEHQPCVVTGWYDWSGYESIVN